MQHAVRLEEPSRLRVDKVRQRPTGERGRPYGQRFCADVLIGRCAARIEQRLAGRH
jgi:hypothetical protein